MSTGAWLKAQTSPKEDLPPQQEMLCVVLYNWVPPQEIFLEKIKQKTFDLAVGDGMGYTVGGMLEQQNQNIWIGIDNDLHCFTFVTNS